MENYFLLAMGYWNLIGSIALYLMLNEAIADTILRQWTEIITQPYQIDKYNSLWLLWAATTNTFFSAINIFAAEWESATQATVIGGDVFVYGIFLLSSIAALKQETYGRGLYITLVLKVFWIFWAIYALLVVSGMVGLLTNHL